MLTLLILIGDLDVEKRNLVKIIDRFGPEFTIEFDIQVQDSQPRSYDSHSDQIYNLFHLTATGGNCCNNGDQVPAAGVTYRNGAPHLYISVTMPHRQVYYAMLTPGKWHSVKMNVQKIADYQSVFMVHLDNKQVWEIHVTPIQYTYVHWYLSNPWDESVARIADFKNFSITYNQGLNNILGPTLFMVLNSCVFCRDWSPPCIWHGCSEVHRNEG